MLLNLNKLAGSPAQTSQLSLSKRVPGHIKTPCTLACTLQVVRCDTYYLLTLHISGDLTITCQRCLGEFTTHYDNQTQLAWCQSDEVAEKLMAEHECLVGDSTKVDLVDIVVDELHLYGPEFHADPEECDRRIGDYLSKISN